MPREFDPYHEWLKIPPAEQPPNHYRLLETARFESDPEIIEAAVSRLVARLQNLSHGQQVAHAQRILNDVAKARLCLSDPQKKSAYDQQLRQQLGFGGVPGSEKKLEPQKTTTANRKQVAASAVADATAGSAKSQLTKPSGPGDKLTAKPGPKKRTGEKSQPQTAIGLLLAYVLGILFVAGAATTFLVIRLANQSDESTVLTETNLDEPGLDDDQPESKLASDAGQTDHVTDQKPTGIEAATVQPKPNSDVVTRPSDNQSVSVSNKTEPASAASSNPTAGAVDSLAQSPAVPYSGNTAMPTSTTPTPPTQQSPSADGIVYLRPEQLDRLEPQLGQLAHLEGIPVKATESKSKKTRYLRFSDEWDKTITVFMSANEVGDELSMDILNAFVGKKIRIHCEVKRDFGSKKIGLSVKAKSQIELVE